MGRNPDDIINSLPTERQEKIAALSQEKVEQTIAHAVALSDFRKAVGKTQAEVAKQLGIKQHAVSQLEKRSDTYVSTLRRFLKSLGMTLELSVVASNGVRIDLPNFLPWQDTGSAADDKKTFAVAAKGLARTPATKAAPTRKISAEETSAKKAVGAEKKRPSMKEIGT